MTPKRSEPDFDDDDEASFAGLVSLSTAPPPPNDVHNASTTVAELPLEVLALLKSGGVPDTAPPNSAIVPTAKSAGSVLEELEPEDLEPEEPDIEIVEMADLTLGSEEPPTIQLETVMIEAGILTPLPPPSSARRLEVPRMIELHVPELDAEIGAIAGVEREFARVPRGWMIAGALVASAMAASVAFVLLWSLL
ncbi:MAG TPA: hypothetical protein VM925_10460 [Labilithrix sp.]|nr:hypothetical protein [Labilithrix sp.]